MLKKWTLNRQKSFRNIKGFRVKRPTLVCHSMATFDLGQKFNLSRNRKITGD